MASVGYGTIYPWFRSSLAFPLGGYPTFGLSQLIIQPTTHHLRGGSQFQVACKGLVDASRDDKFARSGLGGGWTDISAGGLAVVEGELLLALDGSPSGNAAIRSTSTFEAGTMSVEYAITRDGEQGVDADFCAIELEFDGGYIRLARRFSAALSSHVVAVDHVVGGAVRSGGFFESSDLSGKLSIAVWAGQAVAYASGREVWRSINTDLTGAARVVISASSADGYALRSIVRSFTSETLVVIGDTPAAIARGVTGRRVIGTIPAGPAVGLYTVNAYNHTGLVGSRANAFEYVPPPGAVLARERGTRLVSEDDATVRD